MAGKEQKLVLNIKELTAMFFENTRLLGIMTTLKDYQFCWHINNVTGFDLRLNHELEITLTRKRRNYYFSVYVYNEPHKFLAHLIYKNRYDGEYLLPEFRNLDFLWLMKGDEVSDEEVRQTIQTLRTIPNIQLITELAIEKISSKENMVF